MVGNILVTGSEGFLGRYLCKEILASGNNLCWRLHHQGVDLLNQDAADAAFARASENMPLDYVFHLAGFNGGIAFNAAYPADIFTKNTIMALNVLHAANKYRAKKVVSLVASCAYAEQNPFGLLHADSLLAGEPHPSVACHAYAKRNVQLASMYYAMQYNLKAVCVCPPTLYGPGDTFDPLRTKVVGALVRRFHEAKKNNETHVTLWGTGTPRRELLYVADAAALLYRARDYDDLTQPFNLAYGQEVSIASLAAIIADIVDYNGVIRFDGSFEGQQRKVFKRTAAHDLPLGDDFRLTPLTAGLRKTIEYYQFITKE